MSATSAAPVRYGLIVVGDSPDWSREICGLSVLTRAIAALDRADATVFVLFERDTHLAAAARDRAEAELGRMPHRPTVHFGRLPPADRPWVVVLAPGVFDPRIFETPTTTDESAVVAYRREGAAADAFLWITGSAAAADALLPLFMTVRDRESSGPRAEAEGLHASMSAALRAARTWTVDPGEGLCDPLAEVSIETVTGKLFQQARKTSDTWVARNIDRRISLAVTRRLVPYPITPNQITVGATLIGLAGAALLGVGTYASQLLGGVLLTLAIIVDGCDGEVARIKFLESELGRKLDFFLDNVVNVSAIFAVGAGYAWRSGEMLYLYASTAAALAAAAAVLPVYRLFFQTRKEAVRLGAPAPERAPTASSTAALVEAISGRDFAYLILLLAVFGRAQWFALVCVVGIFVFLAAVSVVYVRARRTPPSAVDP